MEEANESGGTLEAYAADAFGRYLSGFGDPRANPYRFGGAWGYITDPSGMLQLGARFYWPEVGRFVQRDPIKDGRNWYVYAEDQPLVYVDPAGLDYYDVGFTVALYPAPELLIGAGLQCGIMFGPDPSVSDDVAWWDVFGAVHQVHQYVHPYAGVGFGTTGGSEHYAPDCPCTQTPGHGLNVQVSGGYYGGGALGLNETGDPFWELGYDTPGFWYGGYYTLF